MTDLRQELGRQIPYLRRYARAITGSQERGDADVRATLERLLGADTPIEPDEVRIALLRALHDLWAETATTSESPSDPDRRLADSTILASRLHHLDPRKRHVLVLTSLEGLPLDQAASVMRLTTREAAGLLEDAKLDLRSQQATRILIIEDEPVIALDIANTVRRNGHSVVGIATTRDEAVALARQSQPGLILADIQLADDSSGIDAVQDILRAHEVPVIFITAFPERLLTGARPEPTFLITKPFDPDTLAVSISQALATAASPPGP